VFAFNQLVVAAVLWLAAQSGPVRGGGRGAAPGLVPGLGIAKPATCGLAAPVRGLRPIPRVRGARRGGVAGAVGGWALAVGLAPYAYLLVTPENAISWARIDGIGALVDHLLRRDYGGPGAFSPHGGELHVAANLAAFAATLGRAWCWIPALAGIAVLG